MLTWITITHKKVGLTIYSLQVLLFTLYYNVKYFVDGVGFVYKENRHLLLFYSVSTGL